MTYKKRTNKRKKHVSRKIAKVLYRKQAGKIDRNLLVLTLFLCLLGLIVVADASGPVALSNFSDRFFYLKQQAFSFIVGLVLLVIAANIKYKFWERIATPLFLISLLFLASIVLPGVGREIMGAKRWLYIGNYSFQPSELVKLTIAVYLAKVASKNLKPISYFLPIGLVFLLIMLQPDLGTAMVITAIGMVQIFLAEVGFLYIIGASLAGAIIGTCAVLFSEYRRNRFLTYLKVTSDPLGKSYHIRQILYALGSGGIFGVGLGQSRQKFLFLPETATDSIFAVIAEETGFFGATLIIILFSFYIYLGLAIVRGSPDTFSRVLSIGIVAWIGGQAFVNIGSMLAIIPLTGIPLPFISFGGSSLITVMWATGILLNISKHEAKEKKSSRRKKT